MATQILTNLTCPSCGHVASGVKPGTRCPQDDGHVLVDARLLAKHGRETMLGRVLADKYALVDVIGQGGMGSVYVGIHESVGREVAVKVIRRLEGPGTDQLRGRFAREAKAIGRLSHDNLVTLFDFGEDQDGTLYLVMEFLRGQSLGARLRSLGALTPVEAVLVTCQILAAISEAHELGLVHRDLKPENIILVPMKDGTQRVKVLDFGIAKAVSAGDDTVETRQGIVLGTPRYMAPEQALGVNIGPKSDLYACGVLLYEMLTGKAPFQGETPFAVLMAHRTNPVPPLPADLGVPPALEQALSVALEKEADRRFADATSMARALRVAVGLSDASTSLPALKLAESGLAETMALGGSTTSELAGQPLTPSSVGMSAPAKSRAGLIAAGVAGAAGLVAGAYFMTREPARSEILPVSAGVAQPAVIVVPRAEPANSQAAPATAVPPTAPPTAAVVSATPISSAPVLASMPSTPPPTQPVQASAAPAAASPRPSPGPTPRPKQAAPPSKPAVRIDEF